MTATPTDDRQQQRWWRWWPRSQRREPLTRLLRAMWRAAPGATLGAAALLVATTALALLSVAVSGRLIDHLTAALRHPGPAAERSTWWTLGILAAVLLSQEVVSSLLWPLIAAVGRVVEGRVRAEVMQTMLSRPDIAHLDDSAVRDAVAAATTVGTARYGPSFAVEGLLPVVGGFLTGGAMAVLLSTFRWWLGPLMVLVWLVARSFVHRERIELLSVYAKQAAATRRFGYFRELALRPQGAKEIRVFGLQTWLVNGFTSFWSTVMHEVWTGRRERLTPLGRLSLLVVGTHVVVVLSIVDGYDRGVVSVGGLVMLLQALIGTSAINLADAGNGDAHVEWGGATVVAADRLRRQVLPNGPAGGRTAAPPRSGIRFEGVTFRYPGQRHDVVSGLDLRVEIGRSLAIVGENGAGKTTLVKLLAGLVQPSGGRILVDGVDLVTLDLRTWHRHFAAVPQDFLQLPASIRDNVTVGRYADTDAGALADVARQAGLADVVARLPAGWDTPVSRELTGGVNLSGGELQRLALGRALWAVHGGAGVLVLDEPTAALDVRAEAAFYDSFLDITAGLTTIVISHRFSTVRRADRIAVLRDGVVGELGSHDELLRLGGTYARYFDLQARIFEAEQADA